MVIGLISCTKSKTPHPAPAQELYHPSALFRKALQHLKPRADHIYVLSAKYGLLPLDQVIAPYDQTLLNATADERRAWSRAVAADLQQRHGPSLRGINFEFHAGEAYSADLRPLLEAAGATCTSPVAGLAIGERQQYYDRSAAGAMAPATLPQQPSPPTAAGRPTGGLSINVEVWLAAALLHEAGLPVFTKARLAEEVDLRFGDRRPGVMTHISAHCVANAPNHATPGYSYLFRTDTGDLRLFGRGDPIHPTRAGCRISPDQAKVPESYWPLWRKYVQ